MGKLFKILAFCLLFAWGHGAAAQTCSNKGQTPATAFPVCGTNVFRQTSVPYCSTNDIYVPGCSSDGANYQNKNPYFYKFTAYQDGPLSFTIKPLAANEDYDWQLWDVTGHDPNDIFSDKTLVVTANWAGTYGPTGASSTGISGIGCASDPAAHNPTFAKSPVLKKDHNYLLMVSHFTDTQSGYDLIFTEGTLIITDTTTPALKRVTPVCGGEQLRIRLNKKLKCSSLAPDGSDFSLNGTAKIMSASAPLCSNGFDMDTILVNLDRPLPPGNYTLTVKKGSDGNTLLDYCDGAVAEGNSLNFTILPLIPAEIDSIGKPGCAPRSIDIYFTKYIVCSSLKADGSNFKITGPQAVGVSGAGAVCHNDQSASVTLTLSQPIVVGGTYTVSILPGLDGNTITDECGQHVPAFNSFSFTAVDTVNAAFSYTVSPTCTNTMVQYAHNGFGNVTEYKWKFSPGGIATVQNPLITYGLIPSAKTSLYVSNGVCNDSAQADIVFANYQNPQFSIDEAVCPGESPLIKNLSTGDIQSYLWDFGNGATSALQDPPSQTFPIQTYTDYIATVTLTTRNSIGCDRTVSNPLLVLHSCYIAVPSAFTPNGDGLNDYLYPLVAYKATQLDFNVYNRFGQRVFHSSDWKNKWDGTVNGTPQDAGTYVWTLSYVLSDTGKKVFQKGSSILIR